MYLSNSLHPRSLTAKAPVSFWVSETFQGRAVKLQVGIIPKLELHARSLTAISPLKNGGTGRPSGFLLGFGKFSGVNCYTSGAHTRAFEVVSLLNPPCKVRPTDDFCRDVCENSHIHLDLPYSYGGCRFKKMLPYIDVTWDSYHMLSRDVTKLSPRFVASPFFQRFTLNMTSRPRP